MEHSGWHSAGRGPGLLPLLDPPEEEDAEDEVEVVHPPHNIANNKATV